jgi:hypothetical protein
MDVPGRKAKVESPKSVKTRIKFLPKANLLSYSTSKKANVSCLSVRRKGKNCKDSRKSRI